MSSRQDGAGRGREFFLSAHRCPEVDLLPHHITETQNPPPCSVVPAVINSELTCTGQSEADYLDVSSCRHSEDEEKEEEEEESISDWSEEDLSLHFSPSVILPSDDEDFDLESDFECVDVTMETQVKGQQVEGLKIKMVPKRQIQLKKRDAENIDTDKQQMILKDGPAEGGGANSEVSANELLCPTIRHRPDLLLRQHSMPASFHPHSTTSSNVDSYSVYRGRVAAAGQGFHMGGNSAPRQRLQKSFSLDETKTKMASCIIKSVLSKKMQVEQSTSNSENHNNSTNCNTKTSHVQNTVQKNHKAPVLPSLQPAEQEGERDGGGGGKAAGVFKAPVHVVRDMRSLVKNTYSLSFRNNSSAPTTQPETNDKPATFKVIGQENSPPPSYQQAVGVKGHHQTKIASVYSSTSRGFVAKVAASLSQSQDRKESDRFNRPITQHRRGSEPIISRNKVDDDTWSAVLLDPPTKPPASSRLSEPSQSERAAGVSHSKPPPPSSTPSLVQGTQLPLSAQGQSSIMGVSSQSQPILHSCFHALPAFPATLHPHLGRVSYVQNPLNFSQLQLQSVPPQGPTLHLLQRSQSEDNSRPTGNTSYQLEGYKGLIKCCPPPSSTAGNQESNCNPVTVSATQEQQQQQHLQQQQQQQQQFLCNVQGFLPAQVGSDFLVDITGSAAAPGALFSGPAPSYHMMLDPKSGRCFYVDTPPQPQRKMLLDPETGQYIEVFLPAASSAPNAGVIAVCGANPAPTVLPVMQFQPPLAMSSLYAPPCLPFTLRTPSVNYTHTAP
ncbi:nuclear factor of activated T-cells 5 [Thunnus thynnus]|uniref:nuclear factor of activated T-cells 5 n=1 Tax=Thunnus thynnus TaxID=8237 RepID=UPI003527440C